MVPMRCSAALALSLALALGACTKESPSMPRTCIDTDRAGYERALTAAPGAVALPGGVAISTCTERVRTDAELQDLGAIVHAVAEELAARAKGSAGGVGADGAGSGAGAGASPDAGAALRLGYLSGAVSAGAAKSNGIAAELARRVETTTIGLGGARDPAGRALRSGAAAGAARG
jgi:hypothetical protein